MKIHFLKQKKLLMPLISVAVVSAWFCWYVWHWEHRAPILEAHFFNVSKGLAVFIRTPQGKTVLIGGGQGGDILAKLSGVLPFYRRKIDEVVFPSDLSSSQGLFDVESRYDIGEKIYATSTLSTHNFEGLPDVPVSLGIFSIGSSTVARISYGKNTFVIADILDKKAQQSMLDLALIRDADVLALRSASASRISSDFFDAVAPSYLVIPKMPSKLKQLGIVKAAVKQVVTTKKQETSKQPKKPKTSPAHRDPPFDLYTKTKVHAIPLDQRGTIEFVSDGERLDPVSSI